MPAEIKRDLEKAGKFIRFETIHWQDKNGIKRKWEVVERIIGADAVMIIPWISQTRELIIIRQYRPPAKGYVYEFPAGLIDPGEDAETAAVRELIEEAGYRGEIISIIPPTFNTPGLSGETVFNVYMDIPAGQIPQAFPEGSEDIEVILLASEKIEEFIMREIEAGNYFDSKLLAYLYGMLTERKINSSDFIRRLPG